MRRKAACANTNLVRCCSNRNLSARALSSVVSTCHAAGICAGMSCKGTSQTWRLSTLHTIVGAGGVRSDIGGHSKSELVYTEIAPFLRRRIKQRRAALSGVGSHPKILVDVTDIVRIHSCTISVL